MTPEQKQRVDKLKIKINNYWRLYDRSMRMAKKYSATLDEDAFEFVEEQPSSPPEPASKEQEGDAVWFEDWCDEKRMSRQLVRLKENKIKWFYNHKPEAKEGKQQWESYTTEQLYQLYKKKP